MRGSRRGQESRQLWSRKSRRRRHAALTRCRKLRRSRSGGDAMMPVTFLSRPTSARPWAPPITTRICLRWPIVRVGPALRLTTVNNLSLNQSKV